MNVESPEVIAKRFVANWAPAADATVLATAVVAALIPNTADAVEIGATASSPTTVSPRTIATFENTSCDFIFSESPLVGCELFTLGSCCGDGAGVTVHGIKLGNSATFAGGGGEVGGGVGFAIKTGIGAGFGAGAGAGDGVAFAAGFAAGAADALFILSSDPPPTTRDITMVRIISFSFPFKEIPNDYGQKYFF
jgi:hypothetical protein